MELAKHGPSHIIFTGRDAARAKAVVQSAKANGANSVTFVPCDQASLASVKQAAERILATTTTIDVLICNAGIAVVPPALTADGYEIQFGTNYLGHALLMRLLVPAICQVEGRIVCLTSLAYRHAPSGGIQFDTLRTSRNIGFGEGLVNYSHAKLANLLYVRALAKHYPDIKVVAIHPGVVKTEMIAKISFWSRLLVNIANPFGQLEPEQGAYCQLWAATTDTENLQNAGFYEPVGEPGREDANSRNEELADALWEWTETALALYVQ